MDLDRGPERSSEAHAWATLADQVETRLAAESRMFRTGRASIDGRPAPARAGVRARLLRWTMIALRGGEQARWLAGAVVQDGVAATRRQAAIAGRGGLAKARAVAAAAQLKAAERAEAAQLKAAERETVAQVREADRETEEAASIAASVAAAIAAREAKDEKARLDLEEQQQRAAEDAAERAAKAEARQQVMIRRLISQHRARRRRRRRLLLAMLILPIVASVGTAILAYYVDTIPAPAELSLPESTTIFFADGATPMAKLGSENRTILPIDQMNESVKHAIVAAEDRTFWTNSGVNLSSVARAAWNNVTGGQTQGGSTITQQYVRMAAGLNGITYARKTREAILAWKMDHSYPKEKILEFYLNTVSFGRGAYGIEAAANTFFGKTARQSAPIAQQVTPAEAMLLAALVKQPEPNPRDPSGEPGYDPARGGVAAANAMGRWSYVRDGMVALDYLSDAEAATLQFPHVLPLQTAQPPDGPDGLIVNHVLSELRLNAPFRGEAPDYIRNGGFRIVTTIDPRAQQAAEAAADVRRLTAPAVVRGQPADWQAALVAVEPGTGRVLAYYGGSQGAGADYAGWYYDTTGAAAGYGKHPPGSSFKVYDLAEALRQGVSLTTPWDSPAVKQFPASGRTNGSKAGPVRNSSTDPCQPKCTLTQATIASLNVPFFDLTEKLGAGNVIDMAARAGIDTMWTAQSARVDLRTHAGKDLVPDGSGVSRPFSTEVGIGQYGITVLDHANGMATFAAGGERADAHFVRSVYQHDTLVYAEQLTQESIGLTPQQVGQLTSVLNQVPSAKLGNGWAAAGKTGTWEAAANSTANAHTWMVGYTNALAAAVWLGTTDGKPLTTKDGKQAVYGSTHAAPIWRQFMIDATAAMGLDPNNSTFPGAQAGATPTPTPTRA